MRIKKLRNRDNYKVPYAKKKKLNDSTQLKLSLHNLGPTAVAAPDERERFLGLVRIGCN